MTEDANLSGFSIGKDELGTYARVSVDPNVYSETAVLKTAYWFTDQYYLFLAGNRATGLLDVEFRLKQGDAIEMLKVACGEFWNNLLDQAVRQRVIEETSAVRDTLLKKAFFEAKAPVPANTVSNEMHIPLTGQGYKDDPARAGEHD